MAFNFGDIEKSGSTSRGMFYGECLCIRLGGRKV